MIEIQIEVFTIIGLTVLISVVMALMGNQLKKTDIESKPKGLAFFGILLVTTIDNMVAGITPKRFVKWLGPYIGVIAIYIFTSNILGLFAIESPTGNYSVTLALAFISWVMIQSTQIKTDGIGGYFKGFFDPIFPFVIPNFFGTIAPLISMSLRLFGNILSGGIIMSLVYTFTGYLSSLIPVIGKFNFIGVVIAPVLHAYFDVFAGFIQMFIFITLTTIFIGTKAADEE